MGPQTGLGQVDISYMGAYTGSTAHRVEVGRLSCTYGECGNDKHEHY